MVTAFENKESKKTGIFLILILIVVVLIIAFVVGGMGGIFGIIKAFFTIGLIVGFFAFLFYIVWFLFFKKQKIDIPYLNWKSYLKSAEDNGADMMEDLILTGDKYHSSKRFMTIKGYLRIKSFDGKDYDMFVGKRNVSNPFEEAKIVMLAPTQHSDLIGDVFVYGISFILKYGYYFLNDTMLDFNAVDKAVASDTFRTVMYQTLGDMKGIMDRAVGLDTEFLKQQQSQKLLKIPILSGQQNNQGNQGNNQQ